MIQRLREWRRWWRRLRPLGDSPPGQASWRTLRRVLVTVVGVLVLLTGIVMLVAPGPALVVIPLGLLLLGFEYAWALRLQRRVSRRIEAAAGAVKQRWRGSA